MGGPESYIRHSHNVGFVSLRDSLSACVTPSVRVSVVRSCGGRECARATDTRFYICTYTPTIDTAPLHRVCLTWDRQPWPNVARTQARDWYSRHGFSRMVGGGLKMLAIFVSYASTM